VSLIGRRDEIAAALSTVTGVHGYAYRPAVPRSGDAWPLLGPLTRAAGMAFEVTWRVLVVLPSDERAASQWVDANYEAVVDALEPIGFVDQVEPVLLSTSAGDQQALQITMRGE